MRGGAAGPPSPGPQKSTGANEPQNSKMKRAIMHKVFIVIVSLVQSCADNLTEVAFSVVIQCIAISFGVRLKISQLLHC